MLWYKAWLETRWRFLIGLALLVCAGALIPLGYRQVLALLPLVPEAGGGEVGRVLRERAALLTTYRGYVWSQWFGQNLTQAWTLFAVLIGTGSLLTQATRGALYTLSMPVSRRRVIGIRASLGLAEMFALAVAPTLVVPALSPLIGQSYSVNDALVHAACIFVGGSVFFCLAFLLSTAFSDVWRPPLITLFIAGALGLAEQLFHDAVPSSLFHVMDAESYFRGGGVPWAGLVVRAALAGGLLYAAVVNISRQDF
jgi:ABC-2 type transport system permease protein